MTLTTLKASLINLLLPNRCPGCDTFLCAGELLCASCEETVLLPHDDYCHTCGKMQCRCKRQPPSYDQAVVCAQYADDPDAPAVRAIWALKNSQNTNFARFTAKILAERLRFSLDYGTYDCVTAVPMHRTKQRMRGYNQSALIGRALAQELGIPFREDLLYKDRSVQAQHTLHAEERARNVSSFHAHDVFLDGMRILLCDDVLTTGATMERCARLLKSCGASHVTAAAAATTDNPQQGDGSPAATNT